MTYCTEFYLKKKNHSSKLLLVNSHSFTSLMFPCSNLLGFSSFWLHCTGTRFFCRAGRRRGSRGSLALPVLYSFLWSGRILCSWISSTWSFRLFTILFCLITNKVGQNISDEVWEELRFSMQVRQAGGRMARHRCQFRTISTEDMKR